MNTFITIASIVTFGIIFSLELSTFIVYGWFVCSDKNKIIEDVLNQHDIEIVKSLSTTDIILGGYVKYFIGQSFSIFSKWKITPTYDIDARGFRVFRWSKAHRLIEEKYAQLKKDEKFYYINF